MVHFFLYIAAGYAVLFLSVITFHMPSAFSADLTILKQEIIAYNLMHNKRSLVDGSYRGEEGILGIRPEVGRLLGLKVLMNEDFFRSKDLFDKAGRSFEKAVEAMTTEERERSPGEHARMASESSRAYNRSLESAREAMKSYRLALTPEADSRLREDICADLLERLLMKSVERSSYNLRDALARFYNQCHDKEGWGAPLNPGNALFVNHLFNRFVINASPETIKRFDLDKCCDMGRLGPASRWRHALVGRASLYAEMLGPVIEKHNNGKEYTVDLLLFLALVRQESGFNPHDVSQVGAVGLTQIMPGTARSLGMKNIFEPGYLDKAVSLMRRERRLRRKALALIPKVTALNGLEIAARARGMMQESLACRRSGRRLYARYKKELLRDRRDERLDPRKAIEYGFRYFSRMLRVNRGDISLALASYNAGLRRVRQYNGIPPYAETVSFRNRVLKYYREYLSQARRYGAGRRVIR